MKESKEVKRIIEGLRTLSKTPFDTRSNLVKISSTAEDILYAVYKAGVKSTKFSPEAKETIGNLIPPALQGLGYQLSTLQSSFASNSIDSVRIQRSGLQFFIDTFKDLSPNPKEKETLEKTLEEFVEREDLAGLDECLKTVEFDPDSDDSQRSVDFEAEIAKLPASHWWFFG